MATARMVKEGEPANVRHQGSVQPDLGSYSEDFSEVTGHPGCEVLTL